MSLLAGLSINVALGWWWADPLVALLIAPAVVALSIGDSANAPLRWGIALVAVLIVVASVVVSKRRPIAVGEVPAQV